MHIEASMLILIPKLIADHFILHVFKTKTSQKSFVVVYCQLLYISNQASNNYIQKLHMFNQLYFVMNK